MSHDYSLCHKSAVYVPRVQFMSQEYSLCPKVQFMTPEYSIYPHRTVYVPTVYVSSVQFMSEVYSSFPMTTVYVP